MSKLVRVFVFNAIVLVGMAVVARAQTPTPRLDVPLLRVSGVYKITCHSPSDADMDQLCFVRTDLADPLELGCVAAGPDVDKSLDLNVAETSGVDAEIRCYAVDTSGLVSDYSPNAGLVDFTRPGRPYVK